MLKTLLGRPLAVAAVITVSSVVAGAQGTPAPTPIKWTLNVDANAKAAPNGTFKASLKATIEEGWHLYALTLPPNGPTATQISLPAPQPFALGGEIAAPPAITAFDPNFGLQLDSYELEATFTLPVKTAATLPAGPHTLTVLVAFQTCDAHVCLPPTDIKVTTTIK